VSYTLTLDMPKEELELAKAQAAEENTDLAKLFVAFLRDRAMKSLEMEKATRQRDAILAAAGGWQDSRTQEEIIAEIEEHRTAGREVVL